MSRTKTKTRIAKEDIPDSKQIITLSAHNRSSQHRTPRHTVDTPHKRPRQYPTYHSSQFENNRQRTRHALITRQKHIPIKQSTHHSTKRVIIKVNKVQWQKDLLTDRQTKHTYTHEITTRLNQSNEMTKWLYHSQRTIQPQHWIQTCNASHK